MHRAVKRPLRDPVDRRTEQHVTDAVRDGQGGGQRHALVRKAQTLGDAKTYRLRASVRAQQARRDAQRQQAGVGYAVIAHKCVLFEDGGEVEVVDAGVVIGKRALVTKRRAHIKSTRLQRLGKVAAKVVGLALKLQAAVQAESRHRA